MKNLLTIIAILICYNSYSQTILNGSFENDSIYPKGGVLSWIPSIGQDLSTFYELLDYVDYVHPLAQFPLKINVQMDTNTYAFNGDYIIYNGYVPDGNYALMLKYFVSEEVEWRSGVSLELSEPLIEGHIYNIGFYKCKQYFNKDYLNPIYLPSAIKIGLSNNKIYAGETINISEKSESLDWEFDSFDFSAPFDGVYITIQGVSEFGRHSVVVDDFVLTHLSGPLPDLNTINDQIDNYTNSVADDLHSNLEYTISPNPSSGEFYINFNEGGALPKHIEIFNQLWQIVYEASVQQSKTKIDLSHLNKGIYFIKADGLGVQEIVLN